MRLSPGRRYAWYLVTAALFATGLIWLVADQVKAGDDAEVWQRISATALMVHGGAAMLATLLVGSLFEVHVLRAWRSRRNRVTGLTMLAVTAVLIVTAFGLYYSGSDEVRRWISTVHIASGLFMPLMIVVHIWHGRRHRTKPEEA